MAGKTITKEIYVVRKLLNLVVADQPATLKSTLSMEKRSADGGG
jgi:hypothetical protein